MTDNPKEREKATPGLSEAMKFWTAVRIQDATSAKYHAEVLVKLESLDRETKVAVINALAELRQKRRVSEPDSPADALPRKERKLQIIPRIRSQRRDPSLESSTDEQLQALNSSLDSLKKGALGQALQMYSDIRHQNDRARILCSLISNKMSLLPTTHKGKKYFYVPQDVALRPSIGNVISSRSKRAEVIGELFKIYIEKLGQ